MKRKNWYPLDNAAKIYPPVSNYMRPSTFTLTAVLKETVNKDILQQATNEILNRFVSFNVKLKRGIFWYYLEENNRPFTVEEEPAYTLKYIDQIENNGYLFRVYYKENRITMEVYHVLADGTGALDVFKSLVFEYLLLSGKKVESENKILTCVTPYTFDESNDAFNKLCDATKLKPEKEKNAFKTDGTPFKYDGCGIITGRINTAQLKAEAKKYDATITAYLSGLYMHCIYESFIKGKKVNNKLVKLLIPINMRKLYDTHTLRNFAMFCRLGHNFEEEISLDECIELCKEQLASGLDKQKLDAQAYSNVKQEKNWLLKIVPLFLKAIVMRIAYNYLGDNLHSANLSNLGVVDLPESMKPYVDDFIFTLGPSFSCKTHLALIGYNDHVTASFSRLFVENKCEKMFFSTLASKGIDVEVSSNYWEKN